MGACSTLYITRTKARSFLASIAVGTDSDDILQEMMRVALADRLYNATIVPDGDPQNDDDAI